jgi:hypothetical protein
MVTQVPTNRTGRNAHVGAFLCGTFALALGLVLILDPEDDDDQPLVINTATPSEPQAKPAAATPQKQLKVAKAQKLKPKKTAFRKRGKRFFHLHQNGPPVQANQRPRRGFCQAPHLALPEPLPLLDAPDVSGARLVPGSSDQVHVSAQVRQHLIRGPPLAARS